ncbi:hypothetical protein K227x_28690 [Rubripirellula lacrimiformis]|uniref:Uncharacterized protein n=1 Tax=Rubripirellula lacrimiformis TaxID=1930273 RepID=A0A517NBU3_9BACT|nr:hypothetical protein [Rubripirellula lacrimiformis]QDT04478.1 hypothetical protein K227x_28690 [Rubripirellula lacrimiformis]
MSETQVTRIEDAATLLEHLEASRVTVLWKIPPQAKRTIRLSPSHLQLLVNDVPVATGIIVDAFKQFICESVGEIEVTADTVLTAKGILTLSTHRLDRMLEINYDYSESPAIVGSCECGVSFISTSLHDFLVLHENDR